MWVTCSSIGRKADYEYLRAFSDRIFNSTHGDELSGGILAGWL